MTETLSRPTAFGAEVALYGQLLPEVAARMPGQPGEVAGTAGITYEEETLPGMEAYAPVVNNDRAMVRGVNRVVAITERISSAAEKVSTNLSNRRTASEVVTDTKESTAASYENGKQVLARIGSTAVKAVTGRATNRFNHVKDAGQEKVGGFKSFLQKRAEGAAARKEARAVRNQVRIERAVTATYNGAERTARVVTMSAKLGANVLKYTALTPVVVGVGAYDAGKFAGRKTSEAAHFVATKTSETATAAAAKSQETAQAAKAAAQRRATLAQSKAVELRAGASQRVDNVAEARTKRSDAAAEKQRSKAEAQEAQARQVQQAEALRMNKTFDLRQKAEALKAKASV